MCTCLSVLGLSDLYKPMVAMEAMHLLTTVDPPPEHRDESQIKPEAMETQVSALK